MYSNLQTLELAGTKFVVLEQSEYQRLRKKAGEDGAGADELPPLPKADKHGLFPAVEYAQTSLARKVIKRRRQAGLTQEELARRAKVSAQLIKKLERGTATVSVAAVDKIDRALASAETKPTRRKR